MGLLLPRGGLVKRGDEGCWIAVESLNHAELAGKRENGNPSSRRNLAEVVEHRKSNLDLIRGWRIQRVHQQHEHGAGVGRCGGDVRVHVRRQLQRVCKWSRPGRSLMFLEEGDLLGRAVFKNLKLLFSK